MQDTERSYIYKTLKYDIYTALVFINNRKWNTKRRITNRNLNYSFILQN